MVSVAREMGTRMVKKVKAKVKMAKGRMSQCQGTVVEESAEI